MANNSSRDVELRIRARDYSQKTLKQIAAAVNELTKSQDAQAASAKKGDTSARDLEASYRKLESAGQALLKLNSLVEVYKRQTAALDAQQKKVEEAVAKQQKLQKEYDNTDKVTKKLETALGRANVAVERSNKGFKDAQDRVSRTANEMKKYGLATDDLARTQQSIVVGVNRVNAALGKQEQIINEAPAAHKRYQAALEAAQRSAALGASKTQQRELEAAAAAKQLARDQAAADALARGRLEEQAHAQNKVIDGLRKQGAEALATARGYQTLGRVISSALAPKDSGLATQLQGIISPAQAARTNLNSLEKQVDTLAKETANAGDKIQNAAAKLKELQASQQAIVSMARLSDTFRQQVAAVRGARTEYQAARREVQTLAAQMKTAQDDTGNLGRRMQEAQQRLNAAASALRSTGDAARQSQAALKAAGFDTRNLSQEDERLRNTAQQTTGAVNTLTEALRRNAGAAKDGGKAFSFFSDNGRTTLSAIQRIRGEVLALTTSYVGIQGGINVASGAIDAFKTRQQAMIKISQIVGHDQGALAAEWDYMVGLSNKLGINIDDLTKGYTAFAIAANSTGLSLKQAKFVFESITKTGRVFHLSADDMQGIFRAMQQMLSKGQVYAEELNGQLGERLPGAVALFAKGMGMTTQELLKAMEKGEVTAQAVINFARANAKAIDAQVAEASKGVDAMEARTQNAMFMFKLALADSGFIDAYVNMLQRITDFLNSSDGKEAAKSLGEAFTQVANAIVWCTENVDLLINALSILAGLKAIQFLGGLWQAAKKLGPALKAIAEVGDGILKFLTQLAARMTAGAGATRVLGIALGALARAIPYVGWALLAYDIGAIFYQQSQTFAKAVDEVVRDFKHLGNQAAALLMTPIALLEDFTYGTTRIITTMFADTLKSIGTWIANVVRLIPGVGEQLGDWVMHVTDEITKENRDMFQNTKRIWDDVSKSWVTMNDEIVKKYSGTMSEVVRETLKAKAQILQADLMAVTGFQFTEDPGGGISPRDREVQALTKEFDKLKTSADKAEMSAKKALQRKNLPGRLALVDEEFAPQMKRAKALGGAEGDKLTKQLQGIIAQRKKAETDEYNASQRTTSSVDKRGNAIQQLTQKYKELQASINQKETQQDPTTSLAERIAASVTKANTEIDKYIASAKKIGGSEGKQLAENFTLLKSVNQQYISNKLTLEEVERLQTRVNALLAIRKSRIEELNSKRQAGVINEDQQVAGVNKVNQETQAPIENAVNALQTAGQNASALLGPEKWAELQANIAATKASLVDLTGTFTKMDTTVVQGVLDGMATGINALVDGLVQVGTGAMSMTDAFAAAGIAVAKFFADFLQKIAVAILQQMALNALASMGGGIGGAAVAAGGVVAKHNGGTVGSSTTGGMQQRSMNPGWFANAPRFHTGGLPGLKSDEVPAILQKGEEVLSKDDPNNIMNMNRSTSSSTSQPPSMRFVLVDDRTKIPEAMNAPEGEDVVMQILKRNATTVRAIASRKSNGRGG